MCLWWPVEPAGFDLQSNQEWRRVSPPLFSILLRSDTDHKTQWSRTILQPRGQRAAGVSSHTAALWLRHRPVHVPAPRSAESHICLSGVSGEEGTRRFALPAQFSASRCVFVEIKEGRHESPHVAAESRISLYCYKTSQPSLAKCRSTLCRSQKESSQPPQPFYFFFLPKSLSFCIRLEKWMWCLECFQSKVKGRPPTELTISILCCPPRCPSHDGRGVWG